MTGIKILEVRTGYYDLGKPYTRVVCEVPIVDMINEVFGKVVAKTVDDVPLNDSVIEEFLNSEGAKTKFKVEFVIPREKSVFICVRGYDTYDEEYGKWIVERLRDYVVWKAQWCSTRANPEELPKGDINVETSPQFQYLEKLEKEVHEERCEARERKRKFFRFFRS